MSNIDRRYSYHDDGVLPSEGEYGVTYLTLYSSGAGNVYDGWMWDPDRVHSSETERTFGYRNPDYPDYCWDDEVVVDLSNAQTRQESSEFEQGRITSYNTNVSSRPILLEDVDITGLNEEEREARATTVLFSAIPLVKDAWIHAEVEIQAKMNISPNNTDGTVRLEAFYILNDESDRTMRPNPVDHRAVFTTDERETFRFLYWNPALKHDVSNYIGVKLLCTGGTAEIGISDNPDYGDAIITLTSAGLVGDHIDDNRPVSLTITGPSRVPYGYEFDPNDFTVMCTYSSGDIYDVSRICSFSMNPGEKFTAQTSYLYAYHAGLTAYKTIYRLTIDHIELIGPESFYEASYVLDISNFTVLAYDSDDNVYDITDACYFYPEMGSIITETTELTAGYNPITSSPLYDTLTITKAEEVIHERGIFGDTGLIYTLYDDRCIRITGNANVYKNGINCHEYIKVPDEILEQLHEGGYTGTLRWAAQGEISGMYLPNSDISILYDFKDVKVKALRADNGGYTGLDLNPFVINFSQNPYITSYMLEFLANVEYDSIEQESNATVIGNAINPDPSAYGYLGSMSSTFKGCVGLRNISFLRNLPFSRVEVADSMFEGCTALYDISGAKRWKFKPTDTHKMFKDCASLTSAGDISLWDMSSNTYANSMFYNSGLKNLAGAGSWKFHAGDHYSQGSYPYSDYSHNYMFAYTNIDDLIGLSDDFFINIYDVTGMFEGWENLKTLKHSAFEGKILNMSKVKNTNSMFRKCVNLEDISDAADWYMSNVQGMVRMFENDVKLPQSHTIDYLTRWVLTNGPICYNMFGTEIPMASSGSAALFWDSYNCHVYTTAKTNPLTPFKWGVKGTPLSEEDRIRLGLAPLDPSSHKAYWYVTEGMFSGYDIMIVSDNDTSGASDVTYINRSFLPSFYREAVAQRILNYGIGVE